MSLEDKRILVVSIIKTITEIVQDNIQAKVWTIENVIVEKNENFQWLFPIHPGNNGDLFGLPEVVWSSEILWATYKWNHQNSDGDGQKPQSRK